MRLVARDLVKMATPLSLSRKQRPPLYSRAYSLYKFSYHFYKLGPTGQAEADACPCERQS